MEVTRKVVAYITRGNDLLVFSHTHQPQAGIQVPAGTVETGETLEQAVLREAREETGLQEFQIRSFLATKDYDFSHLGVPGITRRYYFHLEFQDETPTSWRNNEKNPSDGSEGPIEFEFTWVKMPDEIPSLSGSLGDKLSKILPTAGK